MLRGREVLMVIRIARFVPAPVEEWQRAGEFRDWMKSQPGFVHGWHAIDPVTGEGVSVSVWNSREEMQALKGRVFPGASLALKPSSVAFYDVESQF
jgi:hypothetical protein